MEGVKDIANVTRKCIFCSNMILKWNFGGSELNLFCALSQDMRTTSCKRYELISLLKCPNCNTQNSEGTKYCTECGDKLR